jgi:hypothetical protein
MSPEVALGVTCALALVAGAITLRTPQRTFVVATSLTVVGIIVWFAGGAASLEDPAGAPYQPFLVSLPAVTFLLAWGASLLFTRPRRPQKK